MFIRKSRDWRQVHPRKLWYRESDRPARRRGEPPGGLDIVLLQSTVFLTVKQDHSLLLQVYEVLNTTFTYGTEHLASQRKRPVSTNTCRRYP